MSSTSSSVFICPCCGASSPEGTPGWDRRRTDDVGEPFIWPYLDDEETENPLELWARCPVCVEKGERMPLENVPPLAESLIRAYQQRVDPNASRAKAFAEVWKMLRDSEHVIPGMELFEG